MAELNVQPKKKSALPWILLTLGIIALLFFLLRGCDEDGTINNTNVSTVPSGDTASGAHAGARSGTATHVNPDSVTAKDGTWNDVDFNAPAAAYSEITDKNISVRSNNNYGIYGMGENILFNEGKSTIRQDAEKNLKQIAGSLNKRYSGSDIRVYGFTDAVGSAGYNKQLSEQRAEAVKDWLTKNASISSDKISIQPVGEAQPVASNANDEGRQQNRRVEIVARSSAQAGQ
jgi:outer membrane protein OmpA-like peptidoglycan-associated protein